MIISTVKPAYRGSHAHIHPRPFLAFLLDLSEAGQRELLRVSVHERVAVRAQPQAVLRAHPFLRLHPGVVARAPRRCRSDVRGLSDVLVLVQTARVRPKRRGSALATSSSRALEQDLNHALRKVVTPRGPWFSAARHFRFAFGARDGTSAHARLNFSHELGISFTRSLTLKRIQNLWMLKRYIRILIAILIVFRLLSDAIIYHNYYYYRSPPQRLASGNQQRLKLALSVYTVIYICLHRTKCDDVAVNSPSDCSQEDSC